MEVHVRWLRWLAPANHHTRPRVDPSPESSGPGHQAAFGRVFRPRWIFCSAPLITPPEPRWYSKIAYCGVGWGEGRPVLGGLGLPSPRATGGARDRYVQSSLSLAAVAPGACSARRTLPQPALERGWRLPPRTLQRGLGVLPCMRTRRDS